MAVGLGEHERQPHPHRRQPRRAGDVAATAEHRLGAALGEHPPGGANGAPRADRGKGGAERVAAIETADPEEVDLIAGGGHQLSLGPLAGAEEADLGALSAQRVGDGDRRHDVPRRAAGRYHDSCHWLRASSSCGFRPRPGEVLQRPRPSRATPRSGIG